MAGKSVSSRANGVLQIAAAVLKFIYAPSLKVWESEQEQATCVWECMAAKTFNQSVHKLGIFSNESELVLTLQDM